MSGNVRRRQQQLRLYILVHVVQPRNIWCPIADNNLRSLSSELLYYSGRRLQGRYVTLQDRHPFYGSHRLQIDGNDLRVANPPPRVNGQPLREHLAPAPRRCAQVYGTRARAQEVELRVQLEELEGGAGAVSELLSAAVENVALVFAKLAHWGGGEGKRRRRKGLVVEGRRG